MPAIVVQPRFAVRISVSQSSAFPDCRGTVKTTSRYSSCPVSGSSSSATSTTYCCHGISGVPSCAATSATRGPRVGRSGLRGVAHRGGQIRLSAERGDTRGREAEPVDEAVEAVVIVVGLLQDRVERGAQLLRDGRGGHAGAVVELAGEGERGGDERAVRDADFGGVGQGRPNLVLYGE